jgi:hypothetical protein
MPGGADQSSYGSGRRFAAFISYAHADSAIAAKLQAKLERYRLPKHIAEAHTGGTAALGQIFRDREDLAAAPSLSDAIRAAIAEAEALVVICSPDAKASRWVGEEIALFRALHPNGPVLAALVRGEPEEAFPAPLTADGTEPLAADLRREGDGEALGFLKIVAGIAGVPLDALVQRDAQRRIRRVMWITGGALAAMLVMGIMTTLAIQARNEAARQRAEAEGLVEYMLTDLREKLKGVNRPEVMVPVNERAMEHYRRQGNLEDLPADSLARRARILHVMGEDDDRAGDLPRAYAKFAEARRTTAALLAQEPKNPDRIFAHAQSEYWAGYAALRRNDVRAARGFWLGYLTHAKKLAEVERDTVRSLMELGYANGNMCDLRMRAKIDKQQAVNNCHAAIEYERKALKLRPADRKIGVGLANRLGAMADTVAADGHFENAITLRLEEQAILEALVREDPKNFELRHRRLWPVIGLGWVEYQRKNYAAAERHLRGVATDLRKLNQEFPHDTLISISRVRALIMLAMTWRDAANEDWRSAYLEATQVAEMLTLSGKKEVSSSVTEIIGRFENLYSMRREK